MNSKRSHVSKALIRLNFKRISLSAAGLLFVLTMGLPAHVAAQSTTTFRHHPVNFLNQMLNAYQTGTTLRLVQSYADQEGLGTTAFTYDNALVILAYLAAETGSGTHLAFARLLGDSLLYAQDHDPYHDGRLRKAYWVAPFTLPYANNDSYFIRKDGNVNLVGAPWYFVDSAVGDMAWAGIALAQLYARTGDTRYLNGAVRLGDWIFNNTYDTRGAGGYIFGLNNDNQKVLVKSSEHNIDVYALFSNLLAPLTHQLVWDTRGAHALNFLKAMWNPDKGLFYTGTDPSGVTIAYSPLPEDPQSWSYLALWDPNYARTLDWAKTNLAVTDSPTSPNASFTGDIDFSGVTFSDVSKRATMPAQPTDGQPDPDAVWFEGTAQLALALWERDVGPGPDFLSDRTTAWDYLEQIKRAQDALGNNQTVGGKTLLRGGVVAASSVLNSGFGFSYNPRLHIGATAWYLMAAYNFNPYQLH
jgi:hypothetical protein